jgi:hypothetical protein
VRWAGEQHRDGRGAKPTDAIIALFSHGTNTDLDSDRLLTLFAASYALTE